MPLVAPIFSSRTQGMRCMSWAVGRATSCTPIVAYPSYPVISSSLQPVLLIGSRTLVTTSVYGFCFTGLRVAKRREHGGKGWYKLCVNAIREWRLANSKISCEVANTLSKNHLSYVQRDSDVTESVHHAGDRDCGDCPSRELVSN